MLKEIRVRDYAVIEDVRLEFGPGLTVLTGETGAGKSLVVGALSLLLGERASSEVVRAGAERASVEGRFDISGHPELAARCDDAGIEADDGWLIIRREVQREGRNRAWVNGTSATTALIRELAAELVDLHGQHEHQALLSRPAQRDILDEYAGAASERANVAEAFDRLAALEAERADLLAHLDGIRERADFLRFKLKDIDDAALEAGEEERAEGEARRLEHSEELQELSGGMAETLYGGDEALLDRIGEQGRRLADLVRIDPSAEGLSELYETALHAIEELGRRLAGYHANVEHDPERLESLRRRLSQIDGLKRKYGATVDDIIAEGEAVRAELDTLDASDMELTRLTRRTDEARSELVASCEALRARRISAAEGLASAVTDLLPALGMDGGLFRVALEPLSTPGRAGSEMAEFHVSLNAGFEPAPLARVGSGGELSRVMLALKTVLAAVDRVPTLVFDEIDAGIGGRVANQVAARLAEVAGRHQVFAITHLPQIASRASQHLRVEKAERDGRATTKAVKLSDKERVDELARMLGGDPESAISRKHAKELLTAAGAERAGG
ncbi:MAG: DNA repair protein RecN [Gemmatimonadota bacterium]|jgi:DNA repair protein RecN (Recombination protein N)